MKAQEMDAAVSALRKITHHSQVRTMVLTCLVAVVCYYSDRLMDALGVPPENIASFWPATPFLVAVLISSSRRIWPVLIAAGLGGLALADLRDGWPIGSEAWFTLGNLADVLIATFGISYSFKGVPQFKGLKALAKYFLFPVMLAPFVSALVGAVVSAPGGYWLKWRFWFFACALGFLTVTPAILTWVREGREWAQKFQNYIELAAMMTALVGCGYLAFIGSGRWQSPALLYSLVPILLWAALRLGLKGVSTSMVLVALLSIWGASHDRGPFTGQGPINNALSIQIFLFVASMSFMVLAVLVEEQKRTQQALADKGDQLAEAQRLAQVGSWWWDPKTDTVTWSDELYRIAARDPRSSAPSYAEHSQLYTPESWKRLQNAVEKALATGEAYELDLEMVLPDGSRKWLNARGEAKRDVAGRIAYLRGTVKDISERKRAELALQKSAERFRLASKTGKMFAYEWDVATDVIERSGESAQILQIDEAAPFSGAQAIAKVHPEDREKLKAAVGQLSPEKRYLLIRYRMVQADGTVIWVERNSQAYFGDQGQILCVVGMVTDITERKLAEDRLQEYERAVEGVEEMIVVIDREYRYLIANNKFLKMRNMTKEQVVGHFASEVLNREAFDNVIKERVDESFQGRVVRYEMKYTYPELGERDILVSYFPVEGATGVDRVACIVQDVTERKQAEAALRESEERLRLALQMGKMYAIDWDVATDAVIRSGEATHIHGLPGGARPPTHRQMLDKVHPEDKSTFINSIVNLIPESPNSRTSFRVLRPDGSVLWLERTGHAFFDEQGKIVRMIGIVADITERKLAERELTLASDRLRMAMESGRSVGWDRDVKSGRVILFGNLQSIFGIPLQSFVGRVEDFDRRVHPEDRGDVVKMIDDAMESRKPYKGEFRVVLPDGAVRWLSAKGKFYYSPEREPERMVGMAVDITERKLAEEALSNVSQKLIEAQEHERSRLARELHDDINQRMALLAVSLDRMKQSLPGSTAQLGQQIEEVSNQVADISKDVHAVSHRLHSSKLEILGLAAAARSFCQEFSEQHHVRIEYHSEHVPKELSPQISLSLFRILQEALQNAAKHSGSRHFRVSLMSRANEIELIVHDSGSGFEVEDTIKGRGLGLTSMKERIKLVGGKLSIDSSSQHGTTLHARVPLDPKERSAAAVI